MLAAICAKMRAVRATPLLRYCAAAGVLFDSLLNTGECSGGFNYLSTSTYEAWSLGAPRGRRTDMRGSILSVMAAPRMILLSRL
jgi:hypothetical protein